MVYRSTVHTHIYAENHKGIITSEHLLSNAISKAIESMTFKQWERKKKHFQAIHSTENG